MHRGANKPSRVNVPVKPLQNVNEDFAAIPAHFRRGRATGGTEKTHRDSWVALGRENSTPDIDQPVPSIQTSWVVVDWLNRRPAR